MPAVDGMTAPQILGTPDDSKQRSCVTLFRAARPQLPIWDEVLTKHYAGQPDPMTPAVIA